MTALRLLLSAALLALVLATDAGAANQRGEPLAKALAAEDIELALRRAEAIHPNLFWHGAREVVLARAEALIAALPDPATPMDVYLALSELFGLLGDGHVSAGRPPARGGDVISAYLEEGGALLMARVVPLGDELAVFASATAGIAEYDTIRTINGEGGIELFERAKAVLPGEPAFKRYFAAVEFPSLLWDLGVRAPFTLEGVFAGRPGRIVVPGATQAELDAQPDAPSDSIAYELQADGIGLITFDDMTEEFATFRAKLAAIFKRIAKDRPRGLVIDLRANHGGNSALGDALLEYVSDKPHRPFAHMAVRGSRECRSYYARDFADSPYVELLNELGEGGVNSWPVEIDRPPDNRLRYRGPVAVLIGPGTFSSANILANSIEDFGLATLIGRDTGEIANNYGMVCRFLLPHTGIEISVPAAQFVRANGDAASQEPVHPDISVPRPTGSLAREDLDMAAARRWLLSHFNPGAAADNVGADR